MVFCFALFSHYDKLPHSHLSSLVQWRNEKAEACCSPGFECHKYSLGWRMSFLQLDVDLGKTLTQTGSQVLNHCKGSFLTSAVPECPSGTSNRDLLRH